MRFVPGRRLRKAGLTPAREAGTPQRFLVVLRERELRCRRLKKTVDFVLKSVVLAYSINPERKVWDRGYDATGRTIGKPPFSARLPIVLEVRSGMKSGCRHQD